MKKIFSLSLALILLSITSIAYADVLPDGKKYVPACAIIDNLSSFPNLKLFSVVSEFDISKTTVEEIKSTDCLEELKFQNLELYAVDITNHSIIQSTYNPVNDPAAYKSNIELDVGPEYLDENDSTTYIHRHYIIQGIDNSKKELIIALKSEETNLATKTFPIAPIDIDNSILPHPEFPFSDVKPGSTYYDALTYLKNAGIVSGYADGSFKPENTINRAEFTKIITGSVASASEIQACPQKFIDEEGRSNIFSDINAEAKDWHIPFICFAKIHDVISGYADGNFKPTQNINFAEAAKIIGLAYDLTYNSKLVSPNEPWYKTHIENLAAKKAIPKTIKTFNQAITRGEMAEIIYRLKANKTNLPSQTYAQLQ